MTTVRIALLALGWLAVVGAAARAQTLSVSADVPVAYTFSEEGFQDASPSGAMVGLTLPLLLGLGLEGYTVRGSLADPLGARQPFTYDVTMLEVFLDLPFPGANLRLGGGVGQGQFALDRAPGAYRAATLTQVFVQAGVPWGGIFDVHMGYHVIQGRAQSAGTAGTLPLGAAMATAGLKMGF